MSEELKPCPFCGGNVRFSYGFGYEIYCEECGSRSETYPSKEEAIKAWNCRPSPWHTGKPTEEGDYLVIVEFKKGDTNYDTDYWVNGAWDWYYNQDGVCKIVAWQKIEPYKESEE